MRNRERERESGGDGIEEAVLATEMVTATTTGARSCPANGGGRQRNRSRQQALNSPRLETLASASA